MKVFFNPLLAVTIAGQLIACSPSVEEEPNKACQDDDCKVVLGDKCEEDAACDDDNFCNGTEMCRAGEDNDTVLRCRKGKKPSCDDERVETTDRCDVVTQRCVHELSESAGSGGDGSGGAGVGDGGAGVGDGGAGVGDSSGGAASGDDCTNVSDVKCACVDGEEQQCGPSSEVGECKFGTRRCEGSLLQQCEGAIEATLRDCSSSKDNDCDGAADDSLDNFCQCTPGENRECETHPGFDGVGSCRAGVQSCESSADGARSEWGPCKDSVGPASQDSCVRGDNSNCVGLANEGCECIVGTTANCGAIYSSAGICAPTVIQCDANGTWPDSAACEVAAIQEDCSTQLDENCSGLVNEPSACPCEASPCNNGSQCIAGSGAAYSCDCSGSGHEGQHCDMPRARDIGGPANASSCVVVGVSDDGGVVAAQCEVGESSTRGYFWTQSSGWNAAVSISGYPQVYVRGLSADGSVASGTLRDANNVNYTVKWNSLTGSATLLPDGEWKDNLGLSDSGSVTHALAPDGGHWVWVGSAVPREYPADVVSEGAVSGDGSIVATGADAGFSLWSAPGVGSTVSLAETLLPTDLSYDGTTLIGWFLGATLGIVKYRNGGIDVLNSASTCTPSGLDATGRRVLGLCNTGLTLWVDAAPTRLQALLQATGSTFVLENKDGVLSSSGTYVALPHEAGVVIVHLD